MHEGVTHELCFIEYLWPGENLPVDSRAEDGVPLVTEYVGLGKDSAAEDSARTRRTRQGLGKDSS